MSAAHLDLVWDTQNDLAVYTVQIHSVRSLGSVRQFGAGRRPARCPECRSIIYSRRHRLCGVCGEPLPEDLLFTAMEAQRVERLLQTERIQHRKWLEHRTRSCNLRP